MRARRKNTATADESAPPEVYDLVAEATVAYRRRGSEKAVREFAGVVAIERTAKLLQAYAKNDLDQHGVTYAGWFALTVLSYAKSKALPTAKLAARVGAHPTTLTKTIDHLQRAGFVRRGGRDGDRRVVVVELTSEGDAVQEAIMQRRADVRFGLEALEQTELDELVRLTRKVRLSLGDLWQYERVPADRKMSADTGQ
jgi:DNA-binding MarR family transcriptional regulator